MKQETSPQRRKGAKVAKKQMEMTFLSFNPWVGDRGSFFKGQVLIFFAALCVLCAFAVNK
jgi:hypothetical protein